MKEMREQSESQRTEENKDSLAAAAGASAFIVSHTRLCSFRLSYLLK